MGIIHRHRQHWVQHIERRRTKQTIHRRKLEKKRKKEKKRKETKDVPRCSQGLSRFRILPAVLLIKSGPTNVPLVIEKRKKIYIEGNIFYIHVIVFA